MQLSRGCGRIAPSQSRQTLTDDEQDEKKAYDEWRKFAKPTEAELAKDAEKWRGSVWSVIKARAKVVGIFHSFPYCHPFFWEC